MGAGATFGATQSRTQPDHAAHAAPRVRDRTAPALAPPLRQVQELLGHKHLDSTQRYTRVKGHQLRGAVKRLQRASDAARVPGELETAAPGVWRPNGSLRC